MSELTRDEIRQACEAVGWRWVEEDEAWVPRDSWATGEDDISRFETHSLLGRPTWPCHADGDALALLEATGEEFEISYAPGTTHPYAIRKPAHANGPDLPTAAVRAVNQWAKTRSKKS